MSDSNSINLIRTFKGRFVWGFNIQGICLNNLSQLSTNSNCSTNPNLILVGKKEKPETIEKLKKISGIMYVAGAGYKLLTVALNHANILVTSSKSTYFWDTCAGHAILRSVGGGIIPFDDIDQLNEQNLEDLEQLQIKYKHKHNNVVTNYNNCKGLIAYTRKDILQQTIKMLNSQ